MSLAIEERKARRLAGMQQAKEDTTIAGKAQRVYRALTTGRPPVSEMKSPTAAIGAARVLNNELDKRLKVEGLDTASVKFGVAIAYVSPDLSVIGYTALYAEKSQARIESELRGQVPVGLLFGIADAADPAQPALTGARAFLNTKQSEEWLTELRTNFPLDVADPA